MKAIEFHNYLWNNADAGTTSRIYQSKKTVFGLSSGLRLKMSIHPFSSIERGRNRLVK